MRIIIAGGSGLIGKRLENYFIRLNHEVSILSRNPKRASEIFWNVENPKGLKQFLEGVDVLINLAGKSINCVFNEENKKQILESRLRSTESLCEVVSKMEQPPRIFIQASAIGYYGSTFQECDENSSKGEGFLSDVCDAWEKVFGSYEFPKTKKAIIRISLFLDKNGGALPPLVKNVKLFLGGAAGDGKQFMSWIHHEDFCRAIDFIIQNNLEGTFNFCSPHPVTNSEFMRELRKVYHRPWSPPVPKAIISFVAKYLLKTDPELIFTSQRVIPKKLLDEGFQFKYPFLFEALNHIKSS